MDLLVALILTELATKEADVTMSHKETVRAAVKRQLGAIQNAAYAGGMFPVKPVPELVPATVKAAKGKKGKGKKAAGESAGAGAVAGKVEPARKRPTAAECLGRLFGADGLCGQGTAAGGGFFFVQVRPLLRAHSYCPDRRPARCSL